MTTPIRSRTQSTTPAESTTTPHSHIVDVPDSSGPPGEVTAEDVSFDPDVIEELEAETVQEAIDELTTRDDLVLDGTALPLGSTGGVILATPDDIPASGSIDLEIRRVRATTEVLGTATLLFDDLPDAIVDKIIAAAGFPEGSIVASNAVANNWPNGTAVLLEPLAIIYEWWTDEDGVAHTTGIEWEVTDQSMIGQFSEAPINIVAQDVQNGVGPLPVPSDGKMHVVVHEDANGPGDDYLWVSVPGLFDGAWRRIATDLGVT